MTEELFYSFHLSLLSSCPSRVLNEQFNSWLRENGIDTTGEQLMDVLGTMMVAVIRKNNSIEKTSIVIIC